MMKKAQSAVEFVLLLSFMLFIFAGFFLIIQNKMFDIAEKNDQQYLVEVNTILLNEVTLASISAPDYRHKFYMPTHIQGNPYNLEILNKSEIQLTFDNKEQINFFDTNITGKITFGYNNINRVDGKIRLNDGTNHFNESYKGIFLNINPETCYMLNYSGICGMIDDLQLDLNPNYVYDCQEYFDLCNDLSPLI